MASKHHQEDVDPSKVRRMLTVGHGVTKDHRPVKVKELHRSGLPTGLTGATGSADHRKD